VLHILLAGIPYGIGAAAWGLYILQSPADFLAQYGINAVDGDRFRSIRAPWKALWWEIHDRYLMSFGLSAGRGGPARLKGLILLAYAIGLLGGWLSPQLRAKQAFRVLTAAWVVLFLVLTFLDGQKMHHYLTHSTPFLAVFFGLGIYHHWQEHRFPRALLAAAVVGLFVVETSGLLYRAYLNTYANAYLPACRFIQQVTKPEDRIISSAALLFGLNFRRGFHIDGSLGFYSGIDPDWIIIEAESRADTDRLLQTDSPAGRYAKRILKEESRLVYDHDEFQVYQRLPNGKRPSQSLR
jgi:hypothetical protein